MPDDGTKRPDKPSVYTHDEVDEILRRALERQQATANGVRRDELVEAAGEVGIDAADVDAAIKEIEIERRAEKQIAVTATDERKRQLNAFYRHLGVYLVVNFALFMMDMLTTGGSWFYWPLLGWGIGVGSHAVNVLFPKESKRQRRARRKRRGEREFEIAVERGVEKILSRTDVKPRVELPVAPKRVMPPDADSQRELEDDAAESERERGREEPARRARR